MKEVRRGKVVGMKRQEETHLAESAWQGETGRTKSDVSRDTAEVLWICPIPGLWGVRWCCIEINLIFPFEVCRPLFQLVARCLLHAYLARRCLGCYATSGGLGVRLPFVNLTTG